MNKVLLFCLFSLLAVACSGPRYVDYFEYHDNGRPKPKVAMIPVKDSSGCQVPWNLSKELSQSIYYELMNSGELYVQSPEEVGQVWSKRESIDFFSSDMSFAAEFCGTDFVVAMELLEHSSGPAVDVVTNACHPCNNVVTLRMRLKVMDIRYGCPRVVLYEVVKADYLVASSDCVDFTKECWGASGYLTTPCGIAHQRLVSKVSRRLEETLWTVK